MQDLFVPIPYEQLNARQKEAFNYQKISAVLADFGYITIRLSDDWAGADFIAIHKEGKVLKVQLKGRLSFYEKYRGKDLYICFAEAGHWYIYPHDELLDVFLESGRLRGTASWEDAGGYSFPRIPEPFHETLERYCLPAVSLPSPEIART